MTGDYTPTNEDLATTLETLYWELAQVDSDSDEFPAIENAMLATTAFLREVLGGSLPPGAELREMPYSEVCMHMRVAGRLMWAYALPSTSPTPRMVQLYELASGRSFSTPITYGEAGLHYTSLAVA